LIEKKQAVKTNVPAKIKKQKMGRKCRITWR